MRDFSIPGKPEDYYVVSESNTGVNYYANRSQVRKLVEAYSSYIQCVASSGGNPHTASLDLSDKVKSFISNEPEEAQLAFYDVYTQEMDAATASTMDDTIKINAEATKKRVRCHGWSVGWCSDHISISAGIPFLQINQIN